LQINERRTDDGGFVSVGTDITALKEHQARLLENEQALTATVADLRRSRQQLEKQAQQLVNWQKTTRWKRTGRRTRAGSNPSSLPMFRMNFARR
jgi:FtsZ-binding cell division protein ZapB